MAGTIDVGVVAFVGFIFDVRDIDRDAAFSLLRRLIDLVIRSVGVSLTWPGAFDDRTVTPRPAAD